MAKTSPRTGWASRIHRARRSKDGIDQDPYGRRSHGVRHFRLAVLFVVLLVAFGLGLWGTVIRPPAYEVRGIVVARPNPGLILVRHEAVAALGMTAMTLMAVTGDPATLDAASVGPGDDVRLAVRRQADDVTLIRIEKIVR